MKCAKRTPKSKSILNQKDRFFGQTRNKGEHHQNITLPCKTESATQRAAKWAGENPSHLRGPLVWLLRHKFSLTTFEAIEALHVASRFHDGGSER